VANWYGKKCPPSPPPCGATVSLASRSEPFADEGDDDDDGDDDDEIVEKSRNRAFL